MFKTVTQNVKSGDCPYCGNLSFIYQHQTEMFLCHHCQRHLPAAKMKKIETTETQTSSVNFNSILSYCQPLDTLPDDHHCVQYVKGRKIEDLSGLFFSDKFEKIASTVGYKVPPNERLILPFFDEDGNIFGMQGRSLDNTEPRYVTLMFDKEKDKMFGLNRVNQSEKFFIVEGPIDSLFLKNCCAMAGTDGVNSKYKTQAVLVLDNEPRNKEIVAKYKKYIDKGFSIVIWPDNIKHKDINDMILNDVNVQYVVENNVYAGLAAQIKYDVWKKI